MLENASIPVAKGDICYDEEDLGEYTIKDIGYPIVIKPLDGNLWKRSINKCNKLGGCSCWA